MEKPIISVIIPVYNVAPYLSECLESVAKQKVRDLEIIAVNDGSTDASLAILQDYARKLDNLTIVNQKNAGQSAARNAGIVLAKGTYIHFLDADDYIAENTYLSLIGPMETYQLDMIRFSAMPFLDGVGGTIYKGQYDFSRYFNTGKVYAGNDFLKACGKAFGASPCLYLVRKSILAEHNITFNPSIALHEDELFTLNLFLYIKRAMYDASFYYQRRFRKSSVMTTRKNVNVRRSFDSYYAVIKEMEKMLPIHHDPAARRLIHWRIGKLYGILSIADVPGVFRKEELRQITGITNKEKVKYHLISKCKQYIRRLLHQREFS